MPLVAAKLLLCLRDVLMFYSKPNETDLKFLKGKYVNPQRFMATVCAFDTLSEKMNLGRLGDDIMEALRVGYREDVAFSKAFNNPDLFKTENHKLAETITKVWNLPMDALLLTAPDFQNVSYTMIPSAASSTNIL